MNRHDIIRLLPCRHLLHRKCVAGILDLPAPACPICRSELMEYEPVQRKVYRKYSERDRQRIVSCANRGDDWVNLAASLGINYKTAFHWIQSGRDNMLARGGMKPKIFQEQQVDRMIEWIEDDCDITLKSIQQRIIQEFHLHVSISTIGNYLEGRFFTMKKKHYEPVNMNTEENKRKRAEYVEQLNNFIAAGKQIVWVDETNFNLFCRRTKGRARAGSRAVQKLPAARGPNIHLIGAISAAGVISMSRRRGSYTAIFANEWLQSLLQRWQDLGNECRDLVVVCDNAPCHSRFETVMNETEASLLRLGPYSPMLNPIESIWSKIKSFAKSHIRLPNVMPPNVMEQRINYLERIIDEAKASIVGGDCARAAQHSTIFHARALRLEDMPVGR